MTGNRNSKDFSFPSQLGIFLGLTGAGIVIASLVSGVVWLMMTGKSLVSAQFALEDPANYYALLVMQCVFTFFAFFLPAVFTALICYRSPSRFIGFNTSMIPKQFLWLLAILVLTFPVAGALAQLNQIIPLPLSWETEFKAMEASREAQEAALININTLPKYLISMFIIAFLPGLFEEVCFRGGLQNILTRWFKGPVAAILITAFIFSIIHMSYYGFLVRFALGIILGLIYYYSGSIWLAICYHFLFNGIQVTVLYFTSTAPGIRTKDLEENFPLWAGVIALVLLLYAFMRYREVSKVPRQQYVDGPAGDPNDFHNWINDNRN